MSLSAATVRLVLDPVLSVVFPSQCACCGQTVTRPTRGPLCEPCWAALPRHGCPLCRCGLPLPGRASACARCRRGRNPIAAGASLGPYEGPLRTAIHELKYRGRRRVAGRLAEALLGRPEVTPVLGGGALLVPVPLHPRKRRERGFNQSELLAEAISARAGVPLVKDALVRRRETGTQTGLSAAARRANVRGAFAVRRRARIEGQRIVLLDDVYTTGATALACAQALLAAGAREVRLLTLARVA
ncbi:MAG TPA: ComF family protein [Vicinamibacteria bacterium]